MSAPAPAPARRGNPTDRLLDTARANRAMVWVIAIMMFLTVLATAAGIGTARATGSLGAALESRATVEFVTADPALRTRVSAAAVERLRTLPVIRSAEAVAPAELRQLLAPWLGEEAGADEELPLPTLIDVTLAPGAQNAAIVAALAPVAPGARVDRHAAALAPVARFMVSLASLAFALVVLMLAATAAVVMLAVRSGLEAHRGTIDVMHMLGATDVQVARLFQRRVARDATLGALIGALAGAAVVAVLGIQIARLGSALLGAASLGTGGWVALLLLPLAVVVLATLAARRAVTHALAVSL